MSFSNYKKWTEANLGEMLTFQRGFDITKKEQQPGSYQVISSSGPKSTHFDFKVKGPGVIIGRKGTLGSVFYSEKHFWPHDTTLWVKDFHGNDEKFAYYFLQTMNLEQFDCGASNPTINRNHIHSIAVKFPRLLVQRKIASILSNYDDLIENNTQRRELLEQMAKLIYEEWFVKFRFPGYENIKMIPSDLGEIPEGWKFGRVNDLYKVQPGFAFKSRDFSNSGFPVVKIKNIQNNSVDLEKVDKISSKISLNAYKFELYDGDILIAMTGANVGKIGIMPRTKEKCYLNQRIARFIPIHSQINLNYLYFVLNSNLFENYISNLARGTAQPNISGDNIGNIPMLIPNKSILIKFSHITNTISKEMEMLKFKNQNLRETRDLLLPKLISGEIDVSDLDIRIRSEFQES